ncbi:hypothetical protein ADQ49_27945, partial [Salmonella enterica subsp. enterica]|nr:hypothetical protein [Salmonella enterica subsp. enterica serovar Enteritidis]
PAGEEQRERLIRDGRWSISMRWLRNMDGKSGRNVCAAFSFCDVLGPLTQGFKRNGVQLAILNAGQGKLVTGHR